MDTAAARPRNALILNGEMSEWFKEHAWKTNPATLTEWYRNTSSRNRFNDFPPQNASRCEPISVGICRRFRGDLTQFLHSSERHFYLHSVVRVLDQRLIDLQHADLRLRRPSAAGETRTAGGARQRSAR